MKLNIRPYKPNTNKWFKHDKSIGKINSSYSPMRYIQAKIDAGAEGPVQLMIDIIKVLDSSKYALPCLLCTKIGL